jgi:hypothetical protein
VETSNAHVGNEASVDASGRPVNANTHNVKMRAPAKCQGAMSQQGYGAHGNECYPQNMVQLVGYRDPQALVDARSEATERLRLQRSFNQAAE